MRIGLSHIPQELDALNDADFLAAVRWRSEAPTAVVEAAQAGDITQFVIAARADLESAAKRFRKGPPRRPLATWTSHLDMPSRAVRLVAVAADQSESTGKRVGQNGHAGKHRAAGFERVLDDWLEAVSPGQELFPAEALIVLETLLNPPTGLEVEGWCRLWRLGLTAAARSGGGMSEDPASALITTGELPFQASLLYRHVTHAPRVGSIAARAICQELIETTDTDGTPHGELVTSLSEWLGSHVRSAWWARAFRASLWTPDAAERFAAAIARATEMSRGDGSFVLSENNAPLAAEILPVAVRAAGWARKSPVGRLARILGGDAGKDAGGSSRKGPRPASQSDWAGLAILRNQLTLDADVVALTWHRPSVAIEIGALGTPILSGNWDTCVQAGARAVKLSEDWQCVCWQSDRDGDYIELQQRTSAGVRVERQVFLSRDEHFAILTDSVSTPRDQKLTCTSTIPLAPETTAQADFITREWQLQSGLVPVRVFPANLEQDRVESAGGDCVADDGALVVSRTGRRSVHLAVVLDWHPDRLGDDADWNRLTVTESGRILGSDAAAAFRLRIGGHQLMYYRNLDQTPELRSVLGEHTASETVIGNFTRKGRFDPLVLVDAPE